MAEHGHCRQLLLCPFGHSWDGISDSAIALERAIERCAPASMLPMHHGPGCETMCLPTLISNNTQAGMRVRVQHTGALVKRGLVDKSATRHVCGAG